LLDTFWSVDGWLRLIVWLIQAKGLRARGYSLIAGTVLSITGVIIRHAFDEI